MFEIVEKQTMWLKVQIKFSSNIFVTSFSGHLKSTNCCSSVFQNDMWQEIKKYFWQVKDHMHFRINVCGIFGKWKTIESENLITRFPFSLFTYIRHSSAIICSEKVLTVYPVTAYRPNSIFGFSLYYSQWEYYVCIW